MLQTTALNATEIARVTGLSVEQLTTEQGLALLTGHRAQDKMRSAAGGGKGAAAFAAWIACVQTAMVEIGRHNDKCTDWGYMWFGTHRVYARALRAMRKHARNVYRKAERDQERIELLNPGKKNHKDGPMPDWTKDWANTGWTDERGWLRMPKRASKVSGSRCLKEVTPFAWNTHPALTVWCNWRRKVEAASQSAGTQSDSRTSQRQLNRWVPDEGSRVATGEDTTAYCDGAYNQDSGGGLWKGGFGYTILRGGDGREDALAIVVARGMGGVTTDQAAPVFLGATHHTNNTAELTALAEAMRWLIDVDPEPYKSVLLRPDSQYAMGVAIGDISPKANDELAQNTRMLFQQLHTQRRGKARWAHVKGHSDNIWNDDVDALAGMGAAEGALAPAVQGDAWARTRLDGDLVPYRPMWAIKGMARITTRPDPDAVGMVVVEETLVPAEQETGWYVPEGIAPTKGACLVATDVDEVTRVGRALDDFGALNILPELTHTNGEITRARNHAIHLIHQIERRGLTNTHTHETTAAMMRVKTAYNALARSDERKIARQHIISSGPRVIHEKQCPIDLLALREFIKSPESLAHRTLDNGRKSPNTLRKETQDFLASLHPPPTPGQHTYQLPIQWTHSILKPLAERLVASGHITTCREYAIGTDPFKKWGRVIRGVALGKFGDEMDDEASFPTAGAHLIPVGRDISRTYLRHKEAILAQLAEVYLSTSKILPNEWRDAAKALINSLEMDGTFEGWKTRYGIPVQRSATECSVDLGDGTTFRLADFIAAQPARTQWLVKKCPRMFELIAGAKNQTNDHPERTLKSYVLQELEGRSRNAKIRWAEEHGHEWFSLQHDGVAMGLAGKTTEQAKTALTAVCSAALGYTQRVDVKPMPLRPGISKMEWDGRRVCTPVRVKITPSKQLGADTNEWMVNAVLSRDVPSTREIPITILVNLDEDAKATARAHSRSVHIRRGGTIAQVRAATWDMAMTAARGHITASAISATITTPTANTAIAPPASAPTTTGQPWQRPRSPPSPHPCSLACPPLFTPGPAEPPTSNTAALITIDAAATVTAAATTATGAVATARTPPGTRKLLR